MTSDSRRLAILTAREINELYGLPCFTDQERCIYFDLSPAEHDAVDAVHTDAAVWAYNPLMELSLNDGEVVV
jgi:hypothetical protein